MNYNGVALIILNYFNPLEKFYILEGLNTITVGHIGAACAFHHKII